MYVFKYHFEIFCLVQSVHDNDKNRMYGVAFNSQAHRLPGEHRLMEKSREKVIH